MLLTGNVRAVLVRVSSFGTLNVLSGCGKTWSVSYEFSGTGSDLLFSDELRSVVDRRSLAPAAPAIDLGAGSDHRIHCRRIFGAHCLSCHAESSRRIAAAAEQSAGLAAGSGVDRRAAVPGAAIDSSPTGSRGIHVARNPASGDRRSFRQQ